MSERAALYLRVSTDEGKQTEENQRRELREFVEDEGYELAGEYVDHESGRKGRNEREEFDRMFEAAESREFDVLVFWSLDRFSREGIHKTISYLRQLDSHRAVSEYRRRACESHSPVGSLLLRGV